MKEVKKCSISGLAFTLDIDAYEILSEYLESLKNTYKDSPEGAEIVADIEARIAELILSVQNNSRVVEKPLVQNIIQQLGSPEDITGEDPDSDLHYDEPRIPRRLYRDPNRARLGGVCAGIGRYFDIDPVWIRLLLFLPLVLSAFQFLPFLHWIGPMMVNLFGIFLICYFIMWFAVPVARTARQKLEMRGEKITVQSIGEATSTATDAPDSRAKPIIAEAVSLLGQVVLILLKIITGFIVFGLILGACSMVISLLAMIIGGEGLFTPAILGNIVSPWLASVGIIVALIPTILLIYVLMCLIASRKPRNKTVLTIFLLWVASIIAVVSLAIHEDAGDRFRTKRHRLERFLNSEVIVGTDTMSLEKLLQNLDEKNIVDEGNTIRISVPSKSLDITIDKKQEKCDSVSAVQSRIVVTRIDEQMR